MLVPVSRVWEPCSDSLPDWDPLPVPDVREARIRIPISDTWTILRMPAPDVESVITVNVAAQCQYCRSPPRLFYLMLTSVIHHAIARHGHPPPPPSQGRPGVLQGPMHSHFVRGARRILFVTIRLASNTSSLLSFTLSIRTRQRTLFVGQPDLLFLASPLSLQLVRPHFL